MGCKGVYITRNCFHDVVSVFGNLASDKRPHSKHVASRYNCNPLK